MNQALGTPLSENEALAAALGGSDTHGLLSRVEHVLRQATTGPAAPENDPVKPLVIGMSQFLSNLCEDANCTFLLRNEPLPVREVMSEEMFLPLITWKVQEQGQDLLGEDLGCVLRLDKHSLFGAVAIVPWVTGHMGDLLRAAFFAHYTTRLFGIEPNALIEVEPFYKTTRQSFMQMLRSRQISPDGEVQWPPSNQVPSLQP